MDSMLAVGAVSLLFVSGMVSGCWPKSSAGEQAEIDAISAASKRLFGNNVRGYMWALTTDSPALFAQAPTSIGSVGSEPRAYDPFSTNPANSSGVPPQVANASAAPTLEPYAGGKKIPVAKWDPLNTALFQCWYYAETPVYVRLDGEGLKRLFLDKTKTKKINNNFVDVRAFGAEIEKSEAIRNFEAFALSALPGSCFLLSALGPLKGTAKGVLSNAFCSISLASISSFRKPTADGWGSDKARVQIQNQLKLKVDELEEVNWEVLTALKNKVAEFNSTTKFESTTQVQCPANETWVADLLGGR
ncbi:MAG: hypothetical protein ACO3A4_14450 [Silvanigrellaceae bacterium]